MKLKINKACLSNKLASWVSSISQPMTASVSATLSHSGTSFGRPANHRQGKQQPGLHFPGTSWKLLLSRFSLSFLPSFLLSRFCSVSILRLHFYLLSLECLSDPRLFLFFLSPVDSDTFQHFTLQSESPADLSPPFRLQNLDIILSPASYLT